MIAPGTGGVVTPDSPSAFSSKGNVLGSVTNVKVDQITVVGTPLPLYTPANFSFFEVTTNTQILDGPNLILANATAGAITLTLPTAGGAVGKLCIVVKTDSSANTVTINAATGDSMYKPAAFTNLSTQYQTAQFLAVFTANFNGWVKVA